MKPIVTAALREYLESHSTLHQLRQDFVLCYAKQVPMSAIWLKEGVLRTNFDRSTSKDWHQSGLYFLDELSHHEPLPTSVSVLAGSKFWLVTKSEISRCLQLAGEPLF